eukprot:TRINITY_DN109711_c0_g1_i1.p1 TRINITY_DN109711_c0_g1~~TRINITY_DN109711_c0_g1_i1.p1  ORF type:complete len:128 (-),score=22.91 TRINITY_DN109711_c0_g1_i1:80-463(-)
MSASTRLMQQLSFAAKGASVKKGPLAAGRAVGRVSQDMSFVSQFAQKQQHGYEISTSSLVAMRSCPALTLSTWSEDGIQPLLTIPTADLTPTTSQISKATVLGDDSTPRVPAKDYWNVYESRWTVLH